MELRIALLVLGVIVVAGVYFFTGRRQNAAPLLNSEPGGRVEPSFGDDDASPPLREESGDDLPAMHATPDSQPAGADVAGSASPAIDEGPHDPSPDEPAVPEKVISLRIVKKDGAMFKAEPVILKLRNSGMQHGRFGIFHYLAADGSEDALFSAASLTEPGTFDLQNVKDSELAGLSFFMLRPGTGRGVDAFDKMIETARAVAISLEGELLDGDGSTLSIQRERFLREELIQYELQHLKLS
ncbi:MAG: cell division protein ZipA C-terminal FtsZ-binding domain-containing protein [Pseudomonadota bacterium]